MANRMFQVMLAHELCHRAGGNIPIYGYDLPQWRLKAEARPAPSHGKHVRVVSITKHKFDITAVAEALRQGIVSHVWIRSWGMRLEYYREPAAYAPLFQAPGIEFERVADDEILLHVRAGDIMSGFHPDYFPMPLAYYAAVIAQSGLRPVFLGELDEGPYPELLRLRFPEARFLPKSSQLQDFQTLRHARHVALSVSSYCWLAAWLSEEAETVHMPVCGLFGSTFGRANLVPVGDPRFRFYQVPFPDKQERDGIDLPAWLASGHEIEPIDREDARAMMMPALFGPIRPPKPDD